MGKHKKLQNLSPDVLAKDFWRRNSRFADLFNALIYKKPQIDPATLREMDTDLSSLITDKDILGTIKRVRDTVKISNDGILNRILAIENQQSIHYAMPLRCLLYDVLSYYQQMKGIMSKNKKEGIKDAGEFLSLFKSTDRLLPCRTVVIYYGEKKWDGPKNSKDLMEFSSQEDEKAFMEYSIDLICLNELDVSQYSFKDKDVHDFLLFISNTHQNSRKNLLEELRDMDIEVACAAASITGTLQTYEKEILRQIEEKKERIDMSEALTRTLEEERLEGMKKGKAESVIKLLEELGEIPMGLKKKIFNQGNLKVLEDWLILAARANTIEEFEQRIS